MSLKGVEMQIAVPRTNEATNVQNQLNQRSAYDQAALANQLTKQTERERTKSTEVISSASVTVKEEGKGAAGGRKKRAKGKAKPGQEDAPLTGESGHPFKGKHIDISL